MCISSTHQCVLMCLPMCVDTPMCVNVCLIMCWCVFHTCWHTCVNINTCVSHHVLIFQHKTHWKTHQHTLGVKSFIPGKKSARNLIMCVSSYVLMSLVCQHTLVCQHHMCWCVSHHVHLINTPMCVDVSSNVCWHTNVCQCVFHHVCQCVSHHMCECVSHHVHHINTPILINTPIHINTPISASASHQHTNSPITSKDPLHPEGLAACTICVCVCVCVIWGGYGQFKFSNSGLCSTFYGIGLATISRLLKIISLFCTIFSLLQVSFATET